MQCNGLVQFVDESSRNNALLLHKSQWNHHEIHVAPSRFSLVSVSSQVEKSDGATKVPDANTGSTREKPNKDSAL